MGGGVPDETGREVVDAFVLVMSVYQLPCSAAAAGGECVCGAHLS